MQIFWHTNNGLEAGKLMPKSEKKKLKLMIMVFVDLLLLTSNQLVPPSL